MFDLKNENGTLWAGDLKSFNEAMRIEAMCIEAMGKLAADYGRQPQAETEKLPRLYSRQGNVGIVSVRGPLLNTENAATEYYGVSTYPSIRAAMVFAANDPGVSSILLDIESGGGAVSGVNETAGLISKVDALKPVTAYTSGLCCSAAYWLASSGGALYAGDPTAIVGSIGVITTHVSVAEALKKEGLDVTVLRVGKNKALGHSAEPLSEKAKAHILGQMQTAYDVFTSTVAANRGLDMSARDTWAGGNDFMAAEAPPRLLDGIQAYDDTFAQLAEPVDKRKAMNKHQDNNKRVEVKTPIKANLTAEQLAAIEAGIAGDDVAKAAAEAAAAALAAAETPEAKAQAEADAKAAADAAAAEVVAKAETDRQAAEAAAAEAAAAKTAGGDVVKFLRDELATANAKILEISVAKAAVDAKVSDMSGAHDALLAIAKKSVNVLSIAMGGSEASLANLSALEIVAKHAVLSKDFTDKFKVGGVAVSGAESTAGDVANVIDMNAHAARIKATGLAPRTK